LPNNTNFQTAVRPCQRKHAARTSDMREYIGLYGIYVYIQKTCSENVLWDAGT
jgi:hypothetical protein